MKQQINIGLIGYGKMGKLIHEIALNKGHKVSAIIDPHSKNATAKDITKESLKNCDVLIDFSTPNNAISNLKKVANLKKNYVMGTTGWTNEIEEVKKIVEESKIGFIWASNFSIAVQLFFKIARESAKLINNFDEFDISAWEAHHKHKLDAPSGTALTLGEILIEEIDRKKELLLDRPKGKIKSEELHLTTIRVGEIPGTHGVIFDTDSDTIEIKNTSRNRNGFAMGAVKAAEFIANKKGFYDFAEIF